MFYFTDIKQRKYLIATQYFEGLIKIFDVTAFSLIIISLRKRFESPVYGTEQFPDHLLAKNMKKIIIRKGKH